MEILFPFMALLQTINLFPTGNCFFFFKEHITTTRCSSPKAFRSLKAHIYSRYHKFAMESELIDYDTQILTVSKTLAQLTEIDEKDETKSKSIINFLQHNIYPHPSITKLVDNW